MFAEPYRRCQREVRSTPIGEVAQSPRHQSPYASALRPKLISALGNGYRPYGRSSFTLRTSLIGVASKVLRTFRSRLLIREPESHDGPPMRSPCVACDPSMPYKNEAPAAPRTAGSACQIRFDPMNRCVALRRRVCRVGVGPTRSRFDGRPQ